jgi:hypothetical protein
LSTTTVWPGPAVGVTDFSDWNIDGALNRDNSIGRINVLSNSFLVIVHHSKKVLDEGVPLFGGKCVPLNRSLMVL